jgi:hypothetical protein
MRTRSTSFSRSSPTSTSEASCAKALPVGSGRGVTGRTGCRLCAGLDLDLFYDNTWVDKARADLMGNEDLKRIIGDKQILDILGDPNLRLQKVGAMSNVRKLLAKHFNVDVGGDEEE